MKAKVIKTGEIIDVKCLYSTIYSRLDGNGKIFEEYYDDEIELLHDNEETLGARLRNLLTPYKNLIQLNKDGKDVSGYLEDVERNFKDLLEFSEIWSMENHYLLKK